MNLKSLTKLSQGKIFDYFKEQKKTMFRFITPDFRVITKSVEDGKPLIIEGVINSRAIDSYDEIVSPDAVMKSVEFYQKFPTVRRMHKAEPIGKTLKNWKVGKKVKARINL